MADEQPYDEVEEEEYMEGDEAEGMDDGEPGNETVSAAAACVQLLHCMRQLVSLHSAGPDLAACAD